MKRNRVPEQRKKEPGRKLELVTAPGMPFGYVEAYKSLRTNLKFVTAAENAHSFVITSALSYECKSNISINLAVTLAGENKKVVVIDGDMRKPAIHRMLGLHNNGRGLSSLLSGDSDLSSCIVHLDQLGFDILPVGAVPPNPTELLSQGRMKNLIEVLRAHYDYLIVDAPPISVVTDAAIIGGLVDGAILVVRSDYAPVEMVKLAKKKLEDVAVKIFGVVISRFDAKKSRASSGYYYSYNDYYYSYGYGEKNNK